MFGLMGNCMTWAKGESERKCVTLLAVGLDNAGKTTTVHGVKGEANTDVAPTMGFSSVDLRSGKFNIKIFDLGGGAKIRDIWHNYMAEAHGIIFVVDSADVERMEECREIFDNLISDNRLCGKPVLILANKQDKPQAMDELDICNRLNLDEVVNRNESFSKVVLCSALPMSGRKKIRKPKLDRGIKSGFVWLLDVIGKDFNVLQERITKDVEEQKIREGEERRLRIERVTRIREERERLQNENADASGDRPRPEGISYQELPNDSSPTTVVTPRQDVAQNLSSTHATSGLGGFLMDDDSDDDEVVTAVQSARSDVTAVNLPGAIVTSTVFSETANQQNQISSEFDDGNGDNDGNGAMDNPRSLSAASLRDIVRDVPTPVYEVSQESLRDSTTTTPVLKHKSIVEMQGNNDTGSTGSPDLEKITKKEKKAEKENKIDPGAEEIISEHSFQSGSIPGRLTPIKNVSELGGNGLGKLPPLRNLPNFDSDVEV
uniref:LOW QUALITY PROTEIN: ADP-ribosylation factor-like protein 13B n=1 Tax=Styela clava TaxID=7725 RepID=UPI0019396486|nr:LOW QUALITY PROTEIN: ADP-ribosylation factor-like protein 13B [Styela clava]